MSSNNIGAHWSCQQQTTIVTPEGIFGIAATFVPHSVFFYVGPAAIANAIKDMGAISSVNVLGNSIGVEQAQELIKILQTKEKLTTLCGFSGDETELNLSKKKLSAGCAVLVANEISDMGALKKLNLSDTEIPWKMEKEILKLCSSKGIKLKIGIDGCRGT
jgi:hypothetical protein